MVAKFLDLNKPWSCKYDRKNVKNWHVWLSCSWLHSGTKRYPQFPSIVRKCKWPSLSRKSKIEKVCYHGNLTSQFSSLLKIANEHFNCKVCRNARLRAKPLTWKWFFILMQIKLICIRKVLHLAWFWKWESLELGRAWPIDRHFGEWNFFVQIVDATPGWNAPKQMSLFSSTLYLFPFMVQRHYTGLPGAQSISQINYDLRFSVSVSADQDHSSTEINSIKNWAVKNRMKLNLEKTWEMVVRGRISKPLPSLVQGIERKSLKIIWSVNYAPVFIRDRNLGCCLSRQISRSYWQIF